MGSRRPYIVLAVISVVLSVAVLLLGVQEQHSNNHKFCDVFNALISTQVPRPADPKKDPSRERSYEIYVKFVVLDRALGCEHS